MKTCYVNFPLQRALLLLSLILVVCPVSATESELYYNADGKAELVTASENNIPLSVFVHRIKQENDRFIYERGLNIYKPIRYHGERFQEDAMNYAFSQAGYHLKRLAANTYYVYGKEPPNILGYTEAKEYRGEPYIAMPNYLSDILFMMASDRGYQMIWDSALHRERYYFNNLIELFGEDFQEDVDTVLAIAHQKWPDINIVLKPKLKLMMVSRTSASTN